MSSAARFSEDQPDDFAGPQVKVLYVIPSDRPDRELDINGTLARSVAAFQGWMSREAGGRRFRMDTSNGQLDIAMVRLALTDAQVMSRGVFQRDLLERELFERGFRVPQKIYAVYYEGGSTGPCGAAFRPPVLNGSVVAVYLHGTPPGARPCNTNDFAVAGAPGYFEFLMAHEIFHGMGMVPSCAPNFHDGHVNDDPTDLMYAGPLPWSPSKLDVNRDDYFMHGGNCSDASRSPYLTQ